MSAPVLLGGRRGGGHWQERARVRAAAPPLLVQSGLAREDAQRAADEPHAAVRVVTGAAAGDQVGPALEVGPRPGVWARPSQVLYGGSDARQAVEARAALVGRLQGQVPGYPCGLGEAAPVRG